MEETANLIVYVADTNITAIIEIAKALQRY
jgi:hypothetical protein